MGQVPEIFSFSFKLIDLILQVQAQPATGRAAREAGAAGGGAAELGAAERGAGEGDAGEDGGGEEGPGHHGAGEEGRGAAEEQVVQEARGPSRPGLRVWDEHDCDRSSPSDNPTVRAHRLCDGGAQGCESDLWWGDEETDGGQPPILALVPPCGSQALLASPAPAEPEEEQREQEPPPALRHQRVQGRPARGETADPTRPGQVVDGRTQDEREEPKLLKNREAKHLRPDSSHGRR